MRDGQLRPYLALPATVIDARARFVGALIAYLRAGALPVRPEAAARQRAISETGVHSQRELLARLRGR